MKSYTELIKIPTFKERLNYLRLNGHVGEDTFGADRYLNQYLYNKTAEWKRIRREVIIRDDGWDMALEYYPIVGKVLVHHINPITKEDIIYRAEKIFDLDNLVCVSLDTHNAIHYGAEVTIPIDYIERRKGDTILW